MGTDVVIIGAGISGLTTAHDLVKQGYDVSVLERQVHIGGNAVSRKFDGFLMELGPTTLNAAMHGAMDRLGELGLDGSAKPLGPNVRKRYLRDANRLRGISVNPFGFFLSNYLSPLERLSMAAEILRPRHKGKTEETIHQFVSRRFGAGFADKVIDPMAAGIFMGDSRTLSVSGAFPKLVEMEQRYGSVVRGVLAAKRGSEPGRLMLSWRAGIGTIPQTLAAGLAGRLKTGTTVTRITRTQTGFKVKTARHGTLHTRAVVLAVQPHVAAALLENLDPVAARAAGEIQAPPVGVVFLGYRKSQVTHPLDGLGFLSTRGDRQIISGAQFCSTMFEGRAPDDHVAISCYVGGARNPEIAEMSERELVDCVQKELAGLLAIKGAPVISKSHRWPRGLPHYTLGHAARSMALKDADTRIPGLFITGNYLEGVSVSGCMAAAGATADKVHHMLAPMSGQSVSSAALG